jgi:hypothetical protein
VARPNCGVARGDQAFAVMVPNWAFKLPIAVMIRTFFTSGSPVVPVLSFPDPYFRASFLSFLSSYSLRSSPADTYVPSYLLRVCG